MRWTLNCCKSVNDRTQMTLIKIKSVIKSRAQLLEEEKINSRYEF